MASSTSRMLLKTGNSFPRLLRTRLVSQPHINRCNKQQLLVQSLINPTQKTYEQKPILGDGFNFVEFVRGKDHELRTKQWKSSAAVEARGRRVMSDEDEDEEFDDEEIGPGDDDFGEFSDDTGGNDGFHEYDDDDEDNDDDGDDHGIRA